MPLHDIIDNRQEKLVDHIRTILPNAQAAKFAVGYFFLSGLQSVADQLDNVQELRLLIGNTSNRETVEQIAEGYLRLEQVQEAQEALAYPRRADISQAAAATALAIGQNAALLDQTETSERLVRTLAQLIEEGRLQVRVYTRGRLHAKAYIFDYGPTFDAHGRPVTRAEKGIAVVGSSNFTLSGVSSNTELNVVVHGNANHAGLAEWFQALWDEAEPFEVHLMEELGQAWPLAAITPYELYLKTLYELVREQLDGAGDAPYLWQDEIRGRLTEFQDQAVRRAVQMIGRYGGCFVADVVGLGKSYIGAAIVKQFERRERARPLIICPAPLVDMWESFNEIYDLNARVLSMGMLREDETHGAEWMLHDERFRYRDFVLVDESHNFRNTDSQRYRVLQSYLAAGDRRVVFLTATPRNQSAWDIYNQIKLFHQQDVTDVPIDPPHLRDYFRLADGGERRIQELLGHLLLRRTRMDILRWYGYDAQTGRRVDPDDFAPYRSGARRAYVRVGQRHEYFPRRNLHTVEYSIEAAYQGLYDRLRAHMGRPHDDGSSTAVGAGLQPAQEIIRNHPNPTNHSSDPDELTYARYGLWRYLRPQYQNLERYADLKRAGARLRGLMRVMLFKRFESSVHAFRETIRRSLRIHRHFLAALDQGIVAAGEEAQTLLYQSDEDADQELVDALAQASGRYHIGDFYAEALRADVAQDVRVLEQMLALVERISPAADAKLQTLRQRLDEEPLRAGKRLIFTQYADTAQYLYDHLNPTGRADVEVIYGRQKDKSAIVGRFAPVANPAHRPHDGSPYIDTLIATDVLSEGLNLQDCGMVVNYDLHWNPVRLIQRFGRVDRIGSEHDEIHAFNFLPETELERNLGLEEKLARRIREIHETIGEDAAILHPTEQLNEEAMYTIYTGGDVVQYEDGDDDAYIDLNEAEEIIRQLREDNRPLYDRIANLRDGIRTARAASQPGTVVFCRAGRYKQLYLVDQTGDVLSRDVPRILNLLKCDPATPAVPLPERHNDVVMAVKRRFDEEVTARQAEREHTTSLTRAQAYLRRELRVLYDQAADDDDLRRQIETLERIFTQPIARPAVRGEINRIRREELRGLPLLEALSQVHSLYRLEELRPAEAAAIEQNETLTRIICSEGLLG
jgi:superfamily II DNA/RNA helicase/HKD family nuclease